MLGHEIQRVESACRAIIKADEVAGKESGNRKSFTRRGAMTLTAAGLTMLFWPQSLIAWGIDSYWWGYGTKLGDWSIPEQRTGWGDGDSYISISGEYKYYRGDTGGDRWLSFGVGFRARCVWYTELYYCFHFYPFLRCSSYNVDTDRGHGWVSDAGEQAECNYWIGMDYGVAHECGWANVSEDRCRSNFDDHYFKFGSDFTEEESGNYPGEISRYTTADSGWYDASQARYSKDKNKSWEIVCRRQAADKGVTMWAWTDEYGFNHNWYWGDGGGGWPWDGRSRSQCANNGDMYAETNLGASLQHIYITNDTSLRTVETPEMIAGVYKVINKKRPDKYDDGSAAENCGLSLTTRSASGDNVFAYDYCDETDQNWIVRESYGGYNSFSPVSAPNQDLYLDQHGGCCDENANVDIYSGNGSMAQDWWCHPYRVDSKGRQVYSIMCNCSGRKLCLGDGGSTANGVNVQVWDENANWEGGGDLTWILVPVRFEGKAQLSSEVEDEGGNAIPMIGKVLTCSNPWQHQDSYHPEVNPDLACTPRDAYYTDSVHYCYTWYVDDVYGAHENAVTDEYVCDSPHHRSQLATYTPKKEDNGKYVSCRIRLKMDNGYFYPGEVWAEPITLPPTPPPPVRAPKTVIYHVDEAAWPNPVSDSDGAMETWADGSKKVWVTRKEYVVDATQPYTARADWTAEAKRDGHDADHAPCTRANGADGFDGWYLDPTFRNRFSSYTWQDISVEETLNLYARNIGHVEFTSCTVCDDGAPVPDPPYVSEQLPQGGALDEAAVMPAAVEAAFGSSVNLPGIGAAVVYYDQGGARFDRPLYPGAGWVGSPTSHDTGSSRIARFVQDVTLYKPWRATTYDGVESHSEQDG